MGKGWPTECKHLTNSVLLLLSDCKAAAPIRVITRIEAATYAESVNCRPSLANGDPIGPIEKGITYIVRPFMQPGNREANSRSISSIDIQLPKVPLTPGLGSGTVSFLFFVAMNVLDSTRATSAGSVRAK